MAICTVKKALKHAYADLYLPYEGKRADRALTRKKVIPEKQLVFRSLPHLVENWLKELVSVIPAPGVTIAPYIEVCYLRVCRQQQLISHGSGLGVVVVDGEAAEALHGVSGCRHRLCCGSVSIGVGFRQVIFSQKLTLSSI